MSKLNLTTIILLILTSIMIMTILVIGYIIAKPSESPSPVAPRKTKAQSLTYTKLIAFNRVPTPTEIIVSETPTPTEIILAKATTPTISISPTQVATVSASVSPTRTTSLPETGTINNALFIFTAASLLIFFSFLF